MKQVTMYVTNYCPYCVSAKALLTKRGIEFNVVDVTNDPEKRDWLVKTTGRRTVPQIFIGDEAVGGSDDIHALDARGELVAKVQA